MEMRSKWDDDLQGRGLIGLIVGWRIVREATVLEEYVLEDV